jgi:NADPH:quinone reductase-like Zn-dependent oxidoreductase
MRAIKIIKPGEAKVVDDAAIPKLEPDGVLVKNVAVALNPTDWKHIDRLEVPATVGCDWAGVIEEVGSSVTRPFKKGDRVWGIAYGSNPVELDTGCFGDYVTTRAGITQKIPEHLTFEEASTLGVGILTVGQGLYQEMELPWPDNPLKEKAPILIYGGSTATGALGIQFAKLYVSLPFS